MQKDCNCIELSAHEAQDFWVCPPIPCLACRELIQHFPAYSRAPVTAGLSPVWTTHSGDVAVNEAWQELIHAFMLWCAVNIQACTHMYTQHADGDKARTQVLTVDNTTGEQASVRQSRVHLWKHIQTQQLHEHKEARGGKFCMRELSFQTLCIVVWAR